MMKAKRLRITMLAAMTALNICHVSAEKTMYIPTEWLGRTDTLIYAESDPDCKYTWSKSRCVESDNVIVLWDKGYGSAKPSEVSGSYYVDENALLQKCEDFYQLEAGKLGFVDPETSNLSKYKVMVLMNHSTDWICYGGGYDFEVSALWLSPSTCKPIGFAVAHEVGHSFHYMCYAEATGNNHTSSSTVGTGFHLPVGNGQTIWEQTAQWQACQSYPAEMYNQSIGVFRKSHNLAFTHEWQRYQSYWLHYYLCQKYDDIQTVAQVWNQPMTGASDFNEALMKLKGLSVTDLFRLYYDYAAHCASWDFTACASYRNSYIGDFQYRCARIGEAAYQVAFASTPEATGFNVIPLQVPAAGTEIITHFTALEEGAPLSDADPVELLNGSSSFSQHSNTAYLKSTIPAQRAFRLGYVALMQDGTCSYLHEDRLYCEGTDEKTEDVAMTVPEGVQRLWLIVVPAPKEYVQHKWDENPQNDDQWPYRFQLEGTDLLTTQSGLTVYESETYEPHDIADAIPASWTDTKPTPAEQGWTLYKGGVATSWPNTRYETSSSYPALKNSDGTPFDGTCMFIRWDGNNAYVYGYPVRLEADTDYKFSMSATHWNNGTDAGITASVNTVPTGRESSRLASQLFGGGGLGKNGTNVTFVDGTLTFHTTEAGVYFITLESPTSNALYVIANLSLEKVYTDLTDGRYIDFTSLITYADCTQQGEMASNEWGGSGRTLKKGEHWSGDTARQYFDKNGQYYGQSRQQTITLPATGTYLLKAAVRATSTNARVTIGVGGQQLTTYVPYGRTGGTIATDGTEWESVEAGLAAGKTFANGDKGYGWVYNKIYFTAKAGEQTAITISQTGSAASGGEGDVGGMYLYYYGDQDVNNVGLDEEQTTVEGAAGVDVTLARTFVAGYNSICLPFAVSNITGVFGTGAKAYTLDAVETDANGDYTLNFTEAGTMDANTPYLLNLSETKTSVDFGTVTIQPTATPQITVGSVNFTGTYMQTTAAEGAYLVNASSQTLAKAKGDNTVKAYRAYITLPAAEGEAKVRFTIDGEAIATGIALTETTKKAETTEGVIYNLQGQRISSASSVSSVLPKGVYIVGGKKVLVK